MAGPNRSTRGKTAASTITGPNTLRKTSTRLHPGIPEAQPGEEECGAQDDIERQAEDVYTREGGPVGEAIDFERGCGEGHCQVSPVVRRVPVSYEEARPSAAGAVILHRAQRGY